ncbi:MAG: hypothetical protein WCP92_06030 [bacterium]
MENYNNSATNSASGTSFFGQYKKYFIWGIVIISLLFVIIYPWQVYNYCSTTEVDVLAMQNDCKINMSQAMTMSKGSDKILTREENKLIEVMGIAVGRYKNAGDAFLWIQEQNLQVSAASYQQVRQTLEIYYAKFYAKQESLNDMARTYKRKRATALFGFVSRKFGFPTKEYIDARVDEMVLEKGVNSTYESKDRTMPDIPMSGGDTTKKK